MMPFADSEQQSMLRDTVQKFLAKHYDLQARARIVASDAGWSRKIWQEFAELGLFAAAFPPDLGGFAESMRDFTVIMEELGKRLVVEPVAESILLCGSLIAAAADAEQREALLAPLIAGENLYAFAHREAGSSGAADHVAVSALAEGDGFLVSGQKIAVVGAPWADMLIVSARTAGGVREPEGLRLILIDPKAGGVTLTNFQTVDGRRAADIRFDNVRVGADQFLGTAGTAHPVIVEALDKAIIAQCAEAIGIAAELNAQTIEFAKTRKQFGQPLGRFQVLQHRMVDMYIAQKEAAALVDAATYGFGAGDSDRSRIASAAKVKVAEVSRFVGEEAVQIHGGMGMTDELDIGHYFKRLLAIEIEHGGTQYHLDRYLNG